MEGLEPPPSPSPCTQPSPSPYRNSSTLLKDISEFKTPKRVFPKKLPKPSMEGQEPPPSPSPCTQPSPSPYRNLSTLLKDISEVETPKRPSRISDFYSTCPDFLSSKHYPGSSSSFHRRPSLAPSNYGRTKAAARELNVFKLEHSQWSRKAQIKEGRLLKSLSVWLKFLFQNPTSCGCGLSVDGDRIVTQHTRKRDCDSSWPADAAVHKRYCRGWLIRSCLSCQRRATTTIKSAIPHRLLGASSLLPVVCNGCPLNSTGSLYMVVQRYIRGWLARLRYIHGVALVDKSCNLCQENVVRDLQVRAENTEKSNYEGGSIVTHDISAPDLVKAAIVVQRYIRGWLVRLRYIHGVAIVDKSCNLCQESVERDLQVRAAVKIQLAWKNFSVCRSPLSAFCCN
ncbi:hypothetical protein ACFX13_005286 [Malus domestica]